MTITTKYLKQRLPKNLHTIDGKIVSTIEDARDYMLNSLLADKAEWQCWQEVARLILAEVSAEMVGQQMETALFLCYRLDLSATR
jgi:hypothetical protein